MAYTPSPVKTAPENFGPLPVSANHNAMTGVVGSNFVTRDATTVPVTSPQSIASTTITLTVPQQAVQLQVSAPTAFNISEDSTVSEYLTVPANALYTFDVAKQQFVYINTTSTIVVSFAFKMLV